MSEHGYPKGDGEPKQLGILDIAKLQSGPVAHSVVANGTDPVADAVRGLLAALGVPADDHTTDTPKRVAAYWRTVLGGYDEDPSRHLAVTFPAPEDPGLVAVHGLRFASTCAHHLLPITGTATVAYLPRAGRGIVGLSKLGRVLDEYARRLQVQEQLGYQVADAINERLHPEAVVVILTAQHGCMSVRGIKQEHAETTTTAIRGYWPEALLQQVVAIHGRTS